MQFYFHIFFGKIINFFALGSKESTETQIINVYNLAILIQLAGFAVVVGHTFPVFFGFRGGKGIATSLGILLLLNWKIGLICLIFGILLIALTRMVSLGSIATAVLFPVLTIFIQDSYLVSGNYIVFGIVMASFVIFNHRTNIKRIMSGEENKLSFKTKEEN